MAYMTDRKRARGPRARQREGTHHFWSMQIFLCGRSYFRAALRLNLRADAGRTPCRGRGLLRRPFPSDRRPR